MTDGTKAVSASNGNPVLYTDLAHQTFERAITRLETVAPEQLINELRELLKEGLIHEPSTVIAAIKKHGAEGWKGAS